MWGTSCLFVSWFAPYGFTSGQMTTCRMTIAFAILFTYCLIFRRDAIKIKPKDLLLYFACGAMMFATATFYYESMQLTTASTAVVLMYISPVPIMIISVLCLGESFSVKKGIATGAMLIGCALVAGIIGNFKPNFVGLLMGLLSAVSYTAYNIFNKVSAKRNTDPFTASLYTYMFAAICALILCKPWEIPAIIAENPKVIIPGLILHGLVTCLLPYLIYTISLKFLSVGIASCMSIIEPMTGALLGFIVFKDPLSVPTILGIILIIASVFLLGVSEPDGKKQKEEKES